MRILAFTGLRYTPAAGPVQELAAPPFDQIGPDLRDELHARSPHQFARLTRAIEGAEGDAHRHARAVYERWLEEGAIAPDDQPALYPYTIRLASGDTRLGLCCLVGIGPSSDGDLRPHEQTVDKPLADRLALLEAIRVDLEPVMLVAEDDGSLEQLLAEDTAGPPVASHTDRNGERHDLFRLTDPARIAAYQKLLGPCAAVIADGHHRTKVAQLFAEKHQPEEGTAACAKMAVLFSVASSSLVIDPIHRAVQAPLDTDALDQLEADKRDFEGQSGREMADAVAAARQPAIGVWLEGQTPQIWELDPSLGPSDMPGADTPLAAVLLHYQVLQRAGLSLETATDGSIQYKSDPDDLWRLAEQGQCKAAFWLPPMDPAEFAEATSGGDVLPPKSTRFLPKLISGLVWSSHDGETG